VTRLRMICQSWKVMFHAEYSSGSPLRMLVDLRNVVDAALSRTTKKAEKVVKPPSEPAVVHAKAAAAGAQFATGSFATSSFASSSSEEQSSKSPPLRLDQDSSATDQAPETTRKSRHGIVQAGPQSRPGSSHRRIGTESRNWISPRY